MSNEKRGTVVWHVSWEFPPIVYGGLARHVEALTGAQVASGTAAVTVVTAAEDVLHPERADLPTADLRGGVLVLRARRRHPRTPWSELLAAADELGQSLVETALEAADGPSSGPDVIHAHDWTAAEAACAVARRLDVPFVLTVHATEHGRHQGRVGPDDDHGVPARVHGIEREAVAAADAIIVCSTAMRTEVVEVLGADPARVHVVPNAAGAMPVPAAMRPAPAPPSPMPASILPALGTSGPLLVAAGRLQWEKGFSTLLRAVPRLREALPGVQVVLAGRGTYEPQLRALIAELGIGDVVTLPGWLPTETLTTLYSTADVVVVPSRYEPSGLVAREAQAAGAVVVATAVGGLTDAVEDGVTGRLIGSGDVYALCDVVMQVVADPAAAKAWGQAAATSARAYTWADAAFATSTVYASVITPSGSVTSSGSA